LAALCLATAAAAAVAAPPPAAVELEAMTWTEVRDAVRAGHTTVIVPVGGTEQSGPHLALGKHNVRARLLARRIATQLGDALVAPVVAYVPEGRIDPPQGHMRFAGTLSVPQPAFVAVIEGTARSLRRAGFVDIVLIGDHGGYQALLATLANRLSREWASTPVRVHHVEAFYRTTQTVFAKVLREHGLTPAQIGEHAGAADTALTLALEPSLARPDQFAAAAAQGPAVGVSGDPRAATAALGQLGVDAIVAASVDAIRQARRSARRTAPD
jgi:creatinine amidohydrolase/Fe(II)-dependent formamide hydrolase-like protein